MKVLGWILAVEVMMLAFMISPILGCVLLGLGLGILAGSPKGRKLLAPFKPTSKKLVDWGQNHRASILLTGIVLMAVGTCACATSLSTLFTTINAILDGIGIVLTTIGTVLTPAEAGAISTATTLVEDAVDEVEETVDTYESDKTGAGFVADVQAAVAAVVTNLSGLVAVAQVKNAALQAWITKVATMIGDVVNEVVTDILPAVPAATAAFMAGNSAPAKALDAKIKALAEKLRSDHQAALEASSLPSEAIQKVTSHINSKLAKHIGPIRV